MAKTCEMRNYHNGNFDTGIASKIGDMANDSVDSLSLALAKCDCFDAGAERTACLRNEAQKWLAENAARYSSIPSGYITGIDLAKSFIR